MKKNRNKTMVLFLIDKLNKHDKTLTGDVFAFFPFVYYNKISGYPQKMSYSHIGQHSACHPDYAKECKEATYAQYQDLLKELIGLGYNLEILNSQETELHRNPTTGEIRFGYGATHYRTFRLAEIIDNKGNLKTWIKTNDDKLRYYR